MKLDPREQEIADTFAARIRGAFPGEVLAVKIFGSRARGEARPSSDLDVLVITRTDDWEQRREIRGMAEDVNMERGFDIVLEAVIMGQPRWEQLLSRERRIALDIVRDGIPV